MPTPFADHTGKVFGFWTVKSFYGRDKCGQAVWTCVCKCGNERRAVLGAMQRGASKSCGCMAAALRADKQTKHGMSGTRTYKSWHQMHQRCAGKHGKSYYLDKGIVVCERWNSFENFFADMGERPINTTLDRIDGEKNYEPGNCRWANNEMQGNNKCTNVRQMVCGEVLTVAQAARKYNKHISGVRHRLRKGWSLELAVLTPCKTRKKE